MQIVEYHIEQKHGGEWFGFQSSPNGTELTQKMHALKKAHPDTEYQLIRETKKREVIG